MLKPVSATGSAKQQADAGTRGPGMDGTGDMGDMGGNGATEPGTAAAKEAEVMRV